MKGASSVALCRMAQKLFIRLWFLEFAQMMEGRAVNQEGYKQEAYTWEAHVEKTAVHNVLGSLDAMGSRKDSGNYVSKDCQENKLWLKTDRVMLTDDKEKICLRNCFSSELLLLFCCFCLFSSVLLLFPKRRVFRLESLDKKIKKENAALAVWSQRKEAHIYFHLVLLYLSEICPFA